MNLINDKNNGSRKGHKCSVEDLVRADKKFPTPGELRSAIYELLTRESWLTRGEIADRLEIPKLSSSEAKEKYGYSYRAYNRLSDILTESWVKCELDEEGRKRFAVSCAMRTFHSPPHPSSPSPRIVKNPPKDCIDYCATLRDREVICIPRGLMRDVPYEPKSMEIFIPTLNGAYLALRREVRGRRYIRFYVRKYHELLRWKVGSTRVIKIRFFKEGLESLIEE